MDTTFIIRFITSFAVFMAIDLLWLGVIARGFYSEQLGGLMAKNPIWPVAILFYILFVVGLVYFAIGPGLDAGSLTQTVKNGVLFGFFTYMTYELTNYAVIQNWPVKLVFVDIIWGVALASIVSYISFSILK